MRPDRSWPLDPELAVPPPRAVRIGLFGWLELAVFFGPVATMLALVAWRFLSRPQPLEIEIAFAAFASLGVLLLVRVVALYLTRLELIREGEPVEGVVIEKRRLPFGLARYGVWYTADFRQWKVTALASTQLAEIGDVLTVLIQPGDPRRSLIYRASRCIAEGRTEGAAAAAAASLSAQH